MRWLALLALCAAVVGCHAGGEVGPCVYVTCSGHGLCVELDGSVGCECDDGYVAEGRRCLAEGGDADGGADGDVDGEPPRDGG